MPCPTCDHTLVALVFHESTQYRSCDRCGTIVVTPPGGDDRVYVPKLVERCRVFQADVITNEPELTTQTYIRDKWHRLGIRESINVPADRP